MTPSSPMVASDIMTRDVATITADSALPAAIQLMLDRRVSGLPVVTGVGTLVGILTEGDLLRRAELGTETQRTGWLQFLLGPRHLADDYVETHSRVVGDLMTLAVHTIDEAAPLSEVVDVMLAKHVKRLPVMSGHSLVGVVSRSDLLRALAMAFTDDSGEKPGETSGDKPGDAMIREDVIAALGQHSWGSRGGINVAVADGVVDPDGVIFEEAERAALRVTVQNVARVRTVRDHLEWLPPN